MPYLGCLSQSLEASHFGLQCPACQLGGILGIVVQKVIFPSSSFGNMTVFFLNLFGNRSGHEPAKWWFAFIRGLRKSMNHELPNFSEQTTNWLIQEFFLRCLSWLSWPQSFFLSFLEPLCPLHTSLLSPYRFLLLPLPPWEAVWLAPTGQLLYKAAQVRAYAISRWQQWQKQQQEKVGRQLGGNGKGWRAGYRGKKSKPGVSKWQKSSLIWCSNLDEPKST